MYLDCDKSFLREDNHSAHMRVHLYNPSKLEDTLNYVVEKWAPSKIEKIEKPSLSHEKSDKRKDTRDTLNYVVEKWAPFMGDIQRCLQIPPEDVQDMMENKQIGKLKYLFKEEKPSLVDLSEDSGISVYHLANHTFYKGPDGKTYRSLQVVIDKFQGKDKLKETIMKNGTELCLELGCGKSFNNTNMLRAHQRRKHGAPMLKCQQKGCGQEFCSFTDLCNHVDKGHTV